VGADGGIWLNTPVGSAVRVEDFETGDDALTRYNPVTCPLYADVDISDPVHMILSDDQGKKWLMYGGVLLYFDDAGTPTDLSDDMWAYLGIPAYKKLVSSISLAPLGGLWVKTQTPARSPLSCADSLFYYDIGELRNGFDDTWMPYLLEGQVTSCFALFGPDAGGNTWIKYTAPEDGHGPYSLLNDGGTPLDLSDDEWVSWSEDDGSFFNTIPAQMDSVEGVWIGGYLFRYGDSLADNRDDQWWQIDSHEPTTMAVDSFGGRWFGYQTDAEQNPTIGGTLRYLDDGGTPQDSSDDSWIDYPTSDGLPVEDIREIAIDGLSNKWIVGNHIGDETQLCSLNDNATPEDKSDDTWTAYSTDDGMVNPNVHTMVIDSNNGLWIGTDKGINYLHVDR